MQKVVDLINNYYVSLGKGMESCNSYIDEREISAQRELLRILARDIVKIQTENEAKEQAEVEEQVEVI